MDYSFTEEELEAQEALASVLANAETAGHSPAEIWRSLSAEGWAEALHSQESPLSIPGRAALALEFGRRLVPVPWIPIFGVVLPFLAGIGGPRAAQLQDDVLGNGRMITYDPALAEPSGRVLDATRSGTDLIVNGTIERAEVTGSPAGLLVLIRTPEGQLSSAVIDLGRGEVELQHLTAHLDVSAIYTTISVRDYAISPEDLLGSGAEIAAALEDARANLLLMETCEAVGGMDALLNKSITYAKEREQFGVAIGTFQAVKHIVADMATGTENARALLFLASSGLEAAGSVDPAAQADLAIARLYSVERFVDAGERAIQVYGGMGFTWEAGLHQWYRKALTARHRQDRSKLVAMAIDAA